MSIESIFHNIVINTAEGAERFVNAIEESERAVLMKAITESLEELRSEELEEVQEFIEWLGAEGDVLGKGRATRVSSTEGDAVF